MQKLRATLLATIGLLSGLWIGAAQIRQQGNSFLDSLESPRTQVPEPPSTRVAGYANTPRKPKKRRRDLLQVDLTWGFLKELVSRYNTDLCPAWAASLSFYALLSIPSILLCGLAVLGYLIQDPADATGKVQEVIANLLPKESVFDETGTAVDTTNDTAQQLIKQMNIEKSAEALQKARGWTFAVGFVSLFWSALQIFVNAATPINAAFRVKETRNFLRLRLDALGLLFGAGLLFLLSLLPPLGSQIINALHIPLVGRLPDPLPPLLKLLFLFLGIGINTLMFGLIYRYLPSPSAKVRGKQAIIAGAVVAILWEAAKVGFAFYLTHFGSYNKVYGSLGGLAALVFWIYYTSMLLLLGAEIANLLDERAQVKIIKTSA